MSSSSGWTSSRLDRLTEGTNSYSKLGAELVTFCIGLAKKDYPEYPYSIPDEQGLAVKAYAKALVAPKRAASARNLLQQLLYTLFTEEALTTGARYKLTVYRFLILRSFHEDGHIEWCSTITQHLSKLVFFGRCAIYNRIQETMKARTMGFFSYAILHSSQSAIHLI